MKFLVSGGSQRRDAVWKGEWKHYDTAKLLLVDWDTDRVDVAVEYVSPADCVAGKDAGIVFKAGSLHGDRYYACTQTEVIVYSFPELVQVRRMTLPSFNDVHHVDRIGGRLAVVSSGLDMVIFLDENGNPVEYCNVLGKDPWHKFSQDKDYRKEYTTKPHESHPNYIFQVGSDLWVTRFEQKDAVCLYDQARRIDIGLERVHDGIVVGDKVYFTTVNGMVCVADCVSNKIEQVYDLNKAYDRPNPLGWCRSLHVEPASLFVGFSSLRSTSIRENLAWVKRGFKVSIQDATAMPTRIVEYDITTRKIVKELNLTQVGLDAVFSIQRCA